MSMRHVQPSQIVMCAKARTAVDLGCVDVSNVRLVTYFQSMALRPGCALVTCLTVACTVLVISIIVWSAC